MRGQHWESENSSTRRAGTHCTAKPIGFLAGRYALGH